MMKIFQCLEVEEAKHHALDGGQALHLHRIIVDWDKAPNAFKRAIEAGEDIAHLFDQDEVRLIATVKHLGVKVVFVEHRGTPRQHVDLCGGPLRKAVAMAKIDEKEALLTLAAVQKLGTAYTDEMDAFRGSTA